MPIVEYFHREPAPKKDGKLPEWASFTALVTTVTVFAFTTSSFYVNSVSSQLGYSLAIYFSPADYIRITPVWATPTLGFGLIMMVTFGAMAVAFYVVYLPFFTNRQAPG